MEKYSIINNMKEEKPKLLVVDDEIEQCESLKSYFSKRNFLVFISSTAEEALASIKENKPDLVLLDLKIAGDMDGKGLLRTLRKYDKATRVAVITGDMLEDKEIQEIMDLGTVEFLEKPVDFQTLEKVVKKVLLGAYPEAIHFEEIKSRDKEEPAGFSLRRISHDLSNVAGEIANKCELYLLDTEEGLYKDKTEKERLDAAIGALKSVLKSTQRLADLIKKLSSHPRPHNMG